MIKTRERIRLFKNPVLEWMTHVHPVVPLLMWTPVIIYLLITAIWVDEVSLSVLFTLAVFGILTWTLCEYFLHRFLFHWEPGTPFLRRVVYLFHGIHHDSPQDSSRLVMPPLPALLIASFFYLIFWAVLGSVWGSPFLAFFLVGYLIYDYTHYALHHFKPLTQMGKILRQNHMQHHFQCPDSKFGVTSPLWDYVFGSTSQKSIGLVV
jgi:dihydroceramide fatty acyl 2-hydroxylase